MANARKRGNAAGFIAGDFEFLTADERNAAIKEYMLAFITATENELKNVAPSLPEPKKSEIIEALKAEAEKPDTRIKDMTAAALKAAGLDEDTTGKIIGAVEKKEFSGRYIERKMDKDEKAFVYQVQGNDGLANFASGAGMDKFRSHKFDKAELPKFDLMNTQLMEKTVAILDAASKVENGGYVVSDEAKLAAGELATINQLKLVKEAQAKPYAKAYELLSAELATMPGYEKFKDLDDKALDEIAGNHKSTLIGEGFRAVEVLEKNGKITSEIANQNRAYLAEISDKSGTLLFAKKQFAEKGLDGDGKNDQLALKSLRDAAGVTGAIDHTNKDTTAKKTDRPDFINEETYVQVMQAIQGDNFKAAAESAKLTHDTVEQDDVASGLNKADLAQLKSAGITK